MIYRNVTIAVLGFLLVLFNSCGVLKSTNNDSSTTMGNPMTSLNMAAYSNQNGTASLSSLNICMQGISLTPTSSGPSIQVSFPALQELAVTSSGVALGSLSIPNGTYSQIQLQLSDVCGTQRSIGVINTQGTFNSAQSLNLTFTGQINITENPNAITFDAQPIVNSLTQANSDTNLPVQAVANSGTASMTNLWMSSISTTGAPSARDMAMAVWTGTNVLLWGGENSGNWLGDGFQYNPTTNTWTTMSSVNAPAPRDESAYAWTGSEMLIWSGQTLTQDGGIYNPSTDTWTAMSAVNAPPASHSPAVVWTGTQMLVWGGTNGSAAVNTGGAYNPSTNTWTTITTTGAPPAAAFQGQQVSAVWTGTQMLVWGGDGAGDLYVNTGGAYNPTTNTWSTITTTGAPSARKNFTPIWTGTELIIWGGYNGDPYNDGARYNPTTNTWTAMSTVNAPSPRDSYGAVWTGTQMVVWAGNNNQVNLNDGSIYDPATDTWTPMSDVNVPSARWGPTTLWLGSEMWTWGGSAGSSAPYFNTGAFFLP